MTLPPTLPSLLLLLEQPMCRIKLIVDHYSREELLLIRSPLRAHSIARKISRSLSRLVCQLVNAFRVLDEDIQREEPAADDDDDNRAKMMLSIVARNAILARIHLVMEEMQQDIRQRPFHTTYVAKYLMKRTRERSEGLTKEFDALERVIWCCYQ
ncbi:MAG: hypothetical protein OHK93_002150 [Ramalina farinacea]|uniref:Uncharacterized protein n=1 Tax=Ramalina farinacea TaxID=258253 RepID=A0AA43QQW6_9LECA|nr:hypothetical protein [Ramalina farinacea]